MSGGTATIVCFHDGTTSMYTSSGGGTLGLGGFDAVRSAAAAYLTTVAEQAENFETVDAIVPPGQNFVQIVAVTDTGLKAVRLPFGLAQNPAFPGHNLWVTGQEVISQIRIATAPPE